MPDAYSYYEDLLKRAGENPDKYKNATPGIEKLGDKLYGESEVTDDQVNNYLPEAKQEAEKEVFESRENAELYGFVPGKWLPDWVKNGYNTSLEGMGYQLATGQTYFDIGTYAEDEKDYPFLEDIGSTVMSFLTISDMATLIGGGGIAGGIANVGYKQVAKETVKRLIKKNITNKLGKEGAERAAKKTVEQIVKKNKVKAAQILSNASGIKNKISKEVAEEMVEAGAKKLPSKIMSSTIGGGGGLGFYGGIQSAFGQKLETGDISAVAVLKDTAISTGLGAVTAGSGTGFGKYLSNKLGAPVTATQKFAQGAAVKALETAEFGIATPLLEGRAPELKDFAHAAGVIAGLNVARKIPSTAKKLAGFDNPSLSLKKSASLMADVVKSERGKKQIWQSTRGGLITNVRFEDIIKDNKKVGIEVKANRTEKDYETKSKKDIVLTEEQFIKLGYARNRAGKKQEIIKKSRRQEIFGRKKKLNISNKEFRRMVEAETGIDVNPKKNKTGFSQLSDIQQIKILDRLRKQRFQEQIYKDFKSDGRDDFFIPKRVLTSKLIPEALMQAKNRYSTKIGREKARDIDAADARGITLSGTYLYRLKEKGGLFSGGSLGRLLGRVEVEVNNKDYRIANKVPFKKDGKFYIKLRTKKQADEYFEDVGRRMGIEEHQGDKDVVKLRKIMDDIYTDAKNTGIEVKAYRSNYFPNQLKEEYLKHLGSDIFKIAEANPKFFSTKISDKDVIMDTVGDIIKSKNISKTTQLALKEISKNLIKEAKESGSVLSSKEAQAQAFLKVRDTIFKQRFSVSGNLTKSRTALFPEEFYERDARLVLTKYANDAAKNISQHEFFGAKNEKIDIAIKQLNELSKKAGSSNPKAKQAIEKEIAWLDQVFNSFTNMIELDATKNWKDPRARKVWSDLVDFEVATKIGLGYATIPNITQTFISTAVKAGYYNTFKGTYRLLTDKKYKARVSKSGLSNLSVFQMISGLEPSDAFFGRAAHRLTKASQFQRMNKINQYISAAAGYEYVKNLVDVSNGRGTGLSKLKSKSWARDNLQMLGLPSTVKNLTQRQALESMYRFSRDAQLQRNVLNDPLMFNDPRFRPMFLFKRFGYKQFNWIREQVGQEVFKHGNVLPLLRLGVGGFYGAQFVVWSKKALNNFLSGDEGVFDETQLFIPGLPEGTPLGTGGGDVNTDMSKYRWSDFLDHVAAVGAAGFIGDILANEDKARALEFLVKPAIIQDASKAISALQRSYKDIENYGIGLKTGQRSAKYLSPILGTVPRRLAQQLETKGQKETYIRYRRGIVKGRILDAYLDDNSDEAVKIINAWNNAYPNQGIYYDDVDSNAIYDRHIKKEEKKYNP